MISFDNFTKLFSYDLQNKFCIEIEFSLIGCSDFQCCWMGKMPDQFNKENNVYWYGLAVDGSKAYDYGNFQDFSASPIFGGKSLKEVWEHVELLSIDGCEPEERIQFYLR